MHKTHFPVNEKFATCFLLHVMFLIPTPPPVCDGEECCLPPCRWGGGGVWQTCDHHGSWRCAATSFPSWRCALEVISVSTEFSLQGLMKKKNSPRLFAVSFLFSDDSPGVKLHMCICNITVALVPTCPLIWATVLVVCFSLTHLTQMSPYRWQEATQPDAVS